MMNLVDLLCDQVNAFYMSPFTGNALWNMQRKSTFLRYRIDERLSVVQGIYRRNVPREGQVPVKATYSNVAKILVNNEKTRPVDYVNRRNDNVVGGIFDSSHQGG